MPRLLKKLYLGIDLPQDAPGIAYTHHPLIKTIDLPFADDLPFYTHVVFTSKNGVRAFQRQAILRKSAVIIAVGNATAALLSGHNPLVAEEATAEGVVSLLDKIDLAGATVLWPRSQLARPLISTYLEGKGVPIIDLPIYRTEDNLPPPADLEAFDALVFTSPSCVDAFLRLYGAFPRHPTIEAIGPVTQSHLKRLGQSSILRTISENNQET